MSGHLEMPKHGWFTLQTGGRFVVQIGDLFDANTQTDALQRASSTYVDLLSD